MHILHNCIHSREPMNWRPAFDNDIVQTIVKVNRSSLEDVAKTASLRVLLNLSQVMIIREQVNLLFESIFRHEIESNTLNYFFMIIIILIQLL